MLSGPGFSNDEQAVETKRFLFCGEPSTTLEASYVISAGATFWASTSDCATEASAMTAETSSTASAVRLVSAPDEGCSIAIRTAVAGAADAIAKVFSAVAAIGKVSGAISTSEAKEESLSGNSVFGGLAAQICLHQNRSRR